MSVLNGMPRSWVSIHVPGTAVDNATGTYVDYDANRIPQVPGWVAELDWLTEAPRHAGDYMGQPCSWAVRDLSLQAASELVDSATLPEDFESFVQRGLRDRLRSATDCYFDLGDFTVAVDGGQLLHIVSDSQWVYHWLLFVGADGSSAVLGTQFPAGFVIDSDEQEFWQNEDWRYVLVADSFAEFAWRWWMDNEAFYTAKVDQIALTAAQQRYIDAYGRTAG